MIGKDQLILLKGQKLYKLEHWHSITEALNSASNTEKGGTIEQGLNKRSNNFSIQSLSVTWNSWVINFKTDGRRQRYIE